MLLTLDEVLAMLQVLKASEALITKFRHQADQVLQHKARGRAPDGPTDAVTVSSGFGQKSKQGFVELTINETLTQMEPAKAREIGLMLLQGAEAAVSDEVFVKLLVERIGVKADTVNIGQILLELRDLRQGTRGVAWPT